MMKNLSFLITALLLSACAPTLDDNTGSSSQGNSPETVLESIPMQVTYVTDQLVTTKHGTLKPTQPSFQSAIQPQASVASESVRYQVIAPITLPATVPDAIRLSANMPMRKTVVSKVAVLSQEQGPDSPVVQAEIVPLVAEESGMALQIKGLRQVFSDHIEKEESIDITLTGDNHASFQITLTLRTPPSLKSEQILVSDYEVKTKPIAANMKALRSLSVKLDLLQVIRLTNPSERSKVLALPIRPQGKLSTHENTAQANTSWCSYSLSSQDQDKTLSTEFYLLPMTLSDGVMNDQLPKTFASFIDRALPDNSYELTFDPHEEKLIGIYGSGEQVASLMQNGHSRSNLQSIQVPTSCRSRCGDPRRDMYHWDGYNRARQYWDSQGWPGASRICDRLRSSYRIFPESPVPNEDDFNACAQWELTNGTSPWDDHRFCASMPPGNPWGYQSREYWNVQKTTTTVLVGTQTYPVMLNFDPSSLSATLRYPETALTDLLEIRTLPELIAATSKQAD